MYPCGVPPIISFHRVICFPNQVYGSSSQNTLHHHSFTHTSLSIHANFGATRFINRAFLILLDLLKQVWHLPLKLPFWETLLRRCSTQTLTSLSKTLPWDDPVARALDFEVHRRKMAGKFMSLPLVGWSLHSLITLFSFLFLIVILSDLDFR